MINLACCDAKINQDYWAQCIHTVPDKREAAGSKPEGGEVTQKLESWRAVCSRWRDSGDLQKLEEARKHILL